MQMTCTKINSFQGMMLHPFLSFYEWSLLCSPTLHLFDQKCIKNSTILKYDYSFKNILIYFKM